MLSKLNTLVIIVSVLLVNTANSSSDSKLGKEIVKKVKKKYSQLTSLQADFEQTFKWELAGETQSVKGKIYLSTGNKYRIETGDQLIVTNGKTLWTYSKSDEQVIVDLLTTSDENPLPRDLLFQYSEEFLPSFVREENLSGTKTYLLKLTPVDEEGFIISMKIWVDAKSWFTRKIEQIDLNDNVNTYLMDNIKDNITLNGSLFEFVIPPDVEVIDLRESEL